MGTGDVKEAIALLLLGKVPKIMEKGTRIRGDIHVLLVGDPGMAKSQLLQYTSRIAPPGLYTSGKESTAAGLTATVLREKIKALRNFMDQLLDKVGKMEKNELVKKAIERGLDGELVLVGL